MSSVKFWYLIHTVEQLDFEGKKHPRDLVFGVGHIVHNGVLMCHQSRERLKNETKAAKHKLVAQRLHGVKICEKCMKKFKEHPDLDWQKWVFSPEPKRSATPVKINPMILGE